MSNLKPIATRPGGGGGDAPAPNGGGRTPASSSGVVTPKGRAGAEASESPAANSDASSPWRRFFKAGGASNKGFAPSEGDSFGNQSPRHLVGFSPRGGGSGGSPR